VFSKRRVGVVLLTAAALAGCARRANPPAPARLAILRFENLSADASSDWMGRALAEVISGELSAIPSVRLHGLDRSLGARPISTPGISSERSAAILAGATAIGYGDYVVRGGRIEARLTIEDLGTSKMTAVLSASGGDALQVANSLAKQISAHAAAYETGNPEALKYFATALESSPPAVMVQQAEQSIAADPNFAPPYRLIADAKAQQQDRAGALAILDRALARGGAIPAAERAQLQLEAANLRNDVAARQQALAEVAKANPSDVQNQRALGETAYVRHDYKQAVEAFRKVLEREPKDIALLNEMGYAEAYAGDLEAALRYLRTYQSLQPAEANPLDSMGDVNLIHGRLREAENLYRQADQKGRKLLGGGDLLKAAIARLMTGDIPGASAIFKEYYDARNAMHDPAVVIQAAQWNWLAGRHDAARRQLQEFAAKSEGTQRDLASGAYSQLAIWDLMTDDRAAAAQMAAKAATLASQSSAGTAIVVRFLAQPSASAAEWNTRADRLFQNPGQSGIKDLTLAYALLLDKQFQAASTVLERIYESSNADPGVPIELAWTYMETGREQEAEPLLRFNPVPAGLPAFGDLYFPRIFELRARLAKKLGRADEARSNLELYQKLGGK
jgi:Flp pilus assembly protein TadD